MKIPESPEEFRAIERRQLANIESLRKAIRNAQLDFERACNEYRDWSVKCREEGYG